MQVSTRTGLFVIFGCIAYVLAAAGWGFNPIAWIHRLLFGAPLVFVLIVAAALAWFFLIRLFGIRR